MSVVNVNKEIQDQQMNIVSKANVMNHINKCRIEVVCEFMRIALKGTPSLFHTQKTTV